MSIEIYRAITLAIAVIYRFCSTACIPYLDKYNVICCEKSSARQKRKLFGVTHNNVQQRSSKYQIIVNRIPNRIVSTERARKDPYQFISLNEYKRLWHMLFRV